jgi:hypothetical protein
LSSIPSVQLRLRSLAVAVTWTLDIAPWRDKFFACHAPRGSILDIRSCSTTRE